MEPHTRSEFKRTFSEYLSLPEWDWTYVACQTFDDDKHHLSHSLIPWSWGHFMREIARDAIVNYGFYFAERGRMGRLHWHALVHVRSNLLGQPRRHELQAEQSNRFGFFQLVPFIAQDTRMHSLAVAKIATGIATYLTKYVAKDTWSDDATWDFTGFMGGSKVDCGRIARAIGLPDGRSLPIHTGKECK